MECVAGHFTQEVDVPMLDPDERLDWTEEELAELLKPGIPKNGTEIAAMIESSEFD
ncbi:MAG: hypothetical protein ACYDEO_11205 [Aggregatilineales bacterium]